MTASNVRVLIGDLFESEAQTLVNTVNTVGIMGKGIALGFKQRFPDMFKDYARRCERHEVKLGVPYLWAPMFGKWVLNFPTKEHWRSVASRDAIVQGLEFIEATYGSWGITSLAVPPLGCGEGQLEWSIVGPTLYRHLSRLDIPVELYAPFGTVSAQLEEDFLRGVAKRPEGQRAALRVSPGAVALAAIVARINEQPHHWPVGRMMFQKLAYFATEAEIATNVAFEERSYGAFAPELKRLQARLINNGVLREEAISNGRMFVLRTGPEFRAAEAAYQSYLTQWQDAIERVTDLFLRLDTHQAEVAATVHFVAKKMAREGSASPTEWEVWQYIERWKKARLSSQEVARGIRNLAELGWLRVTHSPALPIDDELAAIV
jgi:O-acetyl-ADP-ribose deacetylase (regulator of RNase III)/uncharacterized protein YwgA